ncbi:hypothetical protein [Patulibacter sp. SYSU D01012]|uniref:hypothetical protein n=1 Tax=Patulibacter sp. SYSU D01012 TaxID=2817381 RepID=UPI001B30759A|nr:hypothetical protein [Patulibacter sp. SYSU D01012]
MSAAPSEDPWRTELTPRSRASRRRWTIVLAAMLLLLGGTAASDPLHDLVVRDGPGARGVLYAIALFVVFGLLRRGTRRLGRLRGDDEAGLDERELSARHRAFRTAFVLFLAVVLITLWALPSVLPPAVAPGEAGDGSALRVTGDQLRQLAAWFLAWAVFLPTAALAWREPDAPAPDEDDVRPVLSEGARDALLALVLVAGAALSATRPDDSPGAEMALGVTPFLLLACVVGALRARREGRRIGRALLSTWPIATVLLLVVCLLVLGLSGASTSGGSGDEETGTVTLRSEPAAEGDYVVRRIGPAGERRRCFLVRDGQGRRIRGAEAREWATRMGERGARLCP